MAMGHEYFSNSNRFPINIHGYISTYNTNLWLTLYVKHSRTQCRAPVNKGYSYGEVYIVGFFVALPLFIYWYVPLFLCRRSCTYIIQIFRRWWNLILSHYYWKVLHDHRKFLIKAGLCFSAVFVERFSFICITHRYLRAVCSENKNPRSVHSQHLRHELEGL